MTQSLIPDPPYVLLIEHDDGLRVQLGHALHSKGFVPLLAKDAAEALHYMAGVCVPALVFMDLDGSACDAEDLLVRFRADARWARVPVVCGTIGPVAIQHQPRFDCFFPKPIDVDALVKFAHERLAS